jgi:U6 snRNA-associated Sm-like protein LSm7
MSERGHFRSGGRGGGRGDSSHRGGRGGGRGAAHGNQQQQEKPKKENILDLTKYMDKAVTVKFNGGRESEHPPSSHRNLTRQFANVFLVTGILKGYDQLMNLVLDDVKEVLRGQQIVD